MSQEDAEKEISFDCLRAKVDEAIKTKNICIIEQIEDEKQLRYMQKYAELLASKIEFTVGNLGIGLAILAISLSYYLSATVDIPNKLMSVIDGSIFLILSIVVIFFDRKLPLVKKNEFIHKIILRIEEKLPTLKDNIIRKVKIMNEEKSKDEWDIMKSEVTDAIDKRKAYDVDFSNEDIPKPNNDC